MTTLDNQIAIYTDISARVLEDNSAMVDELMDVFRYFGLTNVKAYNISEIFEAEFNDKVHLAIIDDKIENSPKRDGIVVAEMIREKYKQARIIFLTGTDNPATLKRLINLKPDEFVDKNEGTVAELRMRLENAVRRQLAVIRSNFEFANNLDDDF